MLRERIETSPERTRRIKAVMALPERKAKKLTVEMARPLLEDWAKMYGITIKWVHEWADGGDQCVTAFGTEPDGAYNHNTLRVATKNL